MDWENDAQIANILHSVLTQGSWEGELNKVTRSGKMLVVESRWFLMLDRSGPPKSIMIVNIDLTQKKHLEAQILRAQRLESIGTLASGIAHDLNNILTPIVAGIPLLRMQPDDPRNERLLTIMEKNALRGAELIRQVLTFARGVEGKRTLVQVRPLVEELRQVMEGTFPKNIILHSEAPSTAWPIHGDITQMYQVLMNLCVNAKDAMPKGGTLTLKVENFHVDAAFAQHNVEAKIGFYVIITVTDTGIGIASEHLDRIFDPFFTTKDIGKGTGLGLSTALSIVKSHQGWIDVKSTLGQGSQFTVYLPAFLESELPPAQLPPANLDGKKQQILVIDDEEAILETTAALLTSCGYSVLTCADGVTAADLYTQHQRTIQVVLVDMVMPILDGAATIERLREINPEVLLIASSGLTEDPMLQVAGFLPKPYTAQELFSALDRVLQKTK